MYQTALGILMARIQFWTTVYEFSFQFWGENNNNVFICKDDVEVASFGGEDTIAAILTTTLLWCEKVNPTMSYPTGLGVATVPDMDEDQ